MADEEYGKDLLESQRGGGPGEMPGEGQEPAAEEASETKEQEYAEQEELPTFHLPPGTLPKGMKVNPGDVIEVRVVSGPDEEGAIPVTYNTGKDDHSEGEPWEKGFMEEMSARHSQTNEPM